jgi:hypothetical protein
LIDGFHFLRVYSDLANNRVDEFELENLYKALEPRVSGIGIESFFGNADPQRLDQAIAVDAVAHEIHQKGNDVLQSIFPGSDISLFKTELDYLSGYDYKSEVRKANRGYFTTLLDDSAFVFLEKEQIGKSVREDITDAIKEYVKLHSIGMASPAEVQTLSRFFPDNEDYRAAAQKIVSPPLIVAGPASVVMTDRQKHLITSDALYRAFAQFMNNPRTRNIQILHTNVQVGWPLPAYINSNGEIFKSGVDDKGLWLITELRNDIKIAQKVAEEIERGRIKSYSIAGTATDTQNISKGSENYMQVNGLELAEVTLCQEGVNQGANFDIIKSVFYDAATSADMDVLKEVFSNKSFNLNDYGVVLENGDKPCIVIATDEQNSLTDSLQLQIRKHIPSDVAIEVRSTPQGDWTPLVKFSAETLRKDVRQGTIKPAFEVDIRKSPLENFVGFITIGMGNERFHAGTMEPMSKHWFYEMNRGDMMAKSAVKAFTDWQKAETDRRKAHREHLDEQGFPFDKDFETEFPDTSRMTGETNVTEIKSSQGYDVSGPQKASEG